MCTPDLDLSRTNVMPTPWEEHPAASVDLKSRRTGTRMFLMRVMTSSSFGHREHLHAGRWLFPCLGDQNDLVADRDRPDSSVGAGIRRHHERHRVVTGSRHAAGDRDPNSVLTRMSSLVRCQSNCAASAGLSKRAIGAALDRRRSKDSAEMGDFSRPPGSGSEVQCLDQVTVQDDVRMPGQPTSACRTSARLPSRQAESR